MLSNKLKVLPGIVLIAFVLVMTQMPIASAKSADDSPISLASLVKFGGDWLAFFNFSNTDDKPATNDSAPNSVLATKTWDGGGASENWSDAANWSGDTVPAAGDTVVFDSTSTKNATIDVNVTVAGFQINTGYSGTISQGAFNFTIGSNGIFNLSGGTYNSGTGVLSFGTNNGNTQSGGDFVCGTGTVNFEGGTFTQSGGTFNCAAAALLNLNFLTLNLNGGSFTAPATTTNYNGGNFNRNGGAFIHSNGTINFKSYSGGLGGRCCVDLNFDGANAGTQDFFNVSFSAAGSNGATSIAAADKMHVFGALNFVDGIVKNFTGGTETTIEAHGNVTVANTFDETFVAQPQIVFAGGGNQIYTNNGAPNLAGVWTLDKTGGMVTLASDLDLSNNPTLQNHVFNLTNGTITTGNFTVNAGTRPISRTNGYVNGKLRRNFSANGPRTFDVGTANGYSPVAVSVTATANSGGLTFGAMQGAHPAMNAANSLARFWTIAEHGDVTANLTFNYLDADVVGDENIYKVSKINNGVTFSDGVTPASNQFTVTGESAFVAYSAGKAPTPCIANQKTWDGEGATNNWSEALNWSCDAVPASTDLIIFNGTSVKNAAIDASITVKNWQINAGYTGTITQGAASTISFLGSSNFTQSSGTFACGGALVSFNSTLFVLNNGGRFNCAASNINSPGTTFNLDSGIFDLPSGTFNLGASNASGSFNRAAATVNPSSGTFVLKQGVVSFGAAGTQELNNFTVDTQFDSAITGTMRVLGTLDLQRGLLSGGVVEAFGNVLIAQTYNNVNAAAGTGIKLLGTATRTVTLPTGLTAAFNPLTVNAPNTIVNTSGTGSLGIRQFILQSGAFEMGAANINVVSNSNQSGGTFTGGSGNFSFNAGATFTLSGGIFTAPTGTMSFNGGIFTISGGTFAASSGTIACFGGSSTFNISPTVSLNNLTVSTNNNSGLILAANKTLKMTGNLNLTDGGLDNDPSATFDVQGNVTIASTSDGGEAKLQFSGAAEQIFTNNGGANPRGAWTINKQSGTVTAATNLILGASQALNITSGKLYLNNNSNLTTGAITIGANGKLVNESATTITLGGNLTNNGIVDLQGGGAACPEADSILIRSSVSGTQRSWTGSGRYRLVDVDVKDMGGAGTKTVFSGTNSGNVNSSWVFDPNCPATLSVTPSSVGVQTGTTQNFTAGGGLVPYTFSILTNNSGGIINPTTGLYTAGNTAGVTDTIRVTDAFSGVADATVNTFGAANKLAFTVQPTGATAGQAISPAIQVTVQDDLGNTVTNSNVSITISIANNPNGGTLSGTLTKNAVNGIATFDNLSINRTSDGYTLRAASNGLTQATSSQFNITVGAATQLAFVVQPSNANLNTNIAPPIQVAIQDANGNVVTTANAAVTIALGNNPSSGTLSGTSTRNAAGGVATFNNLRINNPGSGYTLVASSGASTSATSAAFDILNPFVVTNTNDSGVGSLREALSSSNTLSGTETISFNIPGNAPFTIAVNSQLPSVGSVIIDGTSQPGFAGSPVVELTKAANSNASVGLSVGSAAVVKGLVINGFTTGINISGNGNTVQGSYIGTNVAGDAGKANQTGIRVEGNNNTIGGSTAATRNVISGNTNSGVYINAYQDSNNLVRGNYIGTNAAGTGAVGNSTGISTNLVCCITVSSGNIISDNVISGNLRGIYLTRNNFLVQNNLIGLDASGNNPIPNQMGISLGRNTVNNRLTANRIFGNTQRGISFDFSSFSPQNDNNGDPDTGANNHQNYPVPTSATSFVGNTTVAGTLNSAFSQTFRLEFFSSPTCGSSGNYQGETYLGSTNVTTDASGIVGFTANLPVTTALGRVITATATDAQGNTSTFSQCSRPVAAAVFSISGRIADSAGNPISGVVVAHQGTTATAVTNSNGNYTFNNLPGGGNYTIVPGKANYAFTPASLTFNNLSANQTNQNFTGTGVSTIRGRVQSSLTGTALSAVTITLTGAANHTSQTDSNGNYRFANIPTGSYTVTPSRQDFIFTPSAFNTTLGATTQIVNFSAQGTNARGKIYFRDNNGDFAAINADGSGKVVLNSEVYVIARTDITGDGRKLVFFNNSLNIINSDGSNPVSFSSITGITPAWSPDGSKIAFISNSKIETVNSDGTNRSLIFSASGNCRPNLDIDWSPDGSKIVFDTMDRNICSINPDGTNLQQLTFAGGTFPAVSPDSLRIAYANGANVMLMNIDGSNQTLFFNAGNISLQRIKWSPDGNFLAFRKPNGSQTEVVTINVNGTDLRVISTSEFLFNIVWGKDVEIPTAPGANVNAGAGAVNVAFSNVTAVGTTTVAPISPKSAGILPGGYKIGNQAYEITTTAAVSPPITVCFTVPTTTRQTAFNQMRIMHNENGNLVDRTILAPDSPAPNYATRTLCARTTSLSPFTLAEKVDPNLPSISGLVRDNNGNPLVGVSVNLTGAENRTTETDSDGAFSFVNLTAGANYNVSPKQIGYMFDEYNQDFVDLTDEQTVLFEGTAAEFQISGQVTDANGNGLNNVTVELGGASQGATTTDANGDYVFTDLPADGFYTLAVFDGVNNFNPTQAVVDPLTSNTGGIDFQQSLAPTAASASIGGRVRQENGKGIFGAQISLTDSTGTVRQTLTDFYGRYRFDDVPAGATYIVSASHRLTQFAQNAQVRFVSEDDFGIDFVAE